MVASVKGVADGQHSCQAGYCRLGPVPEAYQQEQEADYSSLARTS